MNIHAVFHCEDCTWSNESYLTAQKKAEEHARVERHRVSGEVARQVIYDYRKNSNDGL